MIAVSTDHRCELLDRYAMTHRMNLYDEVTRTFLMLFDGGAPPATASQTAAHTEWQGRIFDIGPTVLRLAGIDIPETFRGIGLLGDQKPPTFAFTECYLGRLVRGEGYKLIHYDFSHERWKKKKKHRPPGIEEGFVLYDLRADPGETIDISDSQPEQMARMTAVLDEHERELPGGGVVGQRGSVEGLSEDAVERLRVLGHFE